MTVSITKYNFSHDLILHGGVFAMHVLSNDPDLRPTSLDILMALGGTSTTTTHSWSTVAGRAGSGRRRR